MASFKDLETEWSMLCQECTDCWTKTDLQLAAELGKTLLERNKELENNLKQQQNTIDEQAQEIEYMKKQTAALREVNDSRLRVYEQLEVSIQDLERANHRLALENSSDKKQIKSQGLNIESLESKCEELQKKFDELTTEYETLLRRHHAINNDATDNLQTRVTATWKAKVSQDGSIEQVASPSTTSLSEKSMDTSIRELASTLANDDEVTELLRQLHEARNQRAREQKRVVELGEQLNNILLENSNLEEQLNIWKNKAEDMKNLQDEISTLEEVRQGHLCGRCLRGVDNRTHDALSIMLDQEEDDDLSLIESITTDSHRETGTPLPQENVIKIEDEEVEDNPYRVLVEKYEALLEVQRHPAPRRKAIGQIGSGSVGGGGGGGCLSLQEELVMSGDFNSFTSTSQLSVSSELRKTQDQQLSDDVKKLKSDNGEGVKQLGARTSCIKKTKQFSATPTDLSEAESSSSGFSDETSNKSTQTDDRTGSLLCSIADGEDCKFSIYDDASPIESRFRKTPEYRQLFREIFGVLKRAAEAKDEGEKLPLLDDQNATNNANNSHPQKIPLEICNDYDNQSVVSSVISSVVSEPPYRTQTPSITGGNENKNRQENTRKDKINNSGIGSENRTNSGVSRAPNNSNTNHHHHHINQMQQFYTPIKRQPLEYLSIGVNIRKKSSAKKNSAKKLFANNFGDRSSANATPDSTNPKIVQGKGNNSGGGSNSRRRFRPISHISSPSAIGNCGAAGGSDLPENYNSSSNNGGAAVWNGNTLNFFPSKNSYGNNSTTNCSGVTNNVKESSGSGSNNLIASNSSSGMSTLSSRAAGGSNNSFVRYISEKHMNTTGAASPSSSSSSSSAITGNYEYKPGTASAEVARLKRLEMSYAEALRMPNKPKTTNNYIHRRH